jgi:cell division protein FtsI/penicillin-binding protein 2
MLDSASGDVVAMGNAHLQPERPRGLQAAAIANRAVQDLYEPGSTFKIVTLAAA